MSSAGRRPPEDLLKDEFNGLSDEAKLAVTSRAVLRAEPVAWHAGRLSAPDTPVGSASGVLVHVAGQLGLNAAHGKEEREFARSANEVLNSLLTWVHKSTGLPDSLRKSWRAATESANVVVLQSAGDRSFMRKRSEEAVLDACDALLYASDLEPSSEALQRAAIAAVNADIRAAGAPDFEIFRFLRFLARPLWPGPEPSGAMWRFAQSGSARDVATGRFDPQTWEPERLGEYFGKVGTWLGQHPPIIDVGDPLAGSPGLGGAGELPAPLPPPRPASPSSEGTGGASDISRRNWKKAKPPERGGRGGYGGGRGGGGGSRPEEPAPTAAPGPPKADAGQPVAPTGGYVNTGFARHATPQTLLDKRETLRPGEACWFAVQVGALLEGIAEGRPTRIDPQLLPEQAELDVVVFAFPGELELEPKARRGQLQLGADGAAQVLRQPTEGLRGAAFKALREALSREDVWKQRLFFPAQAGVQPGPQRLRCSVYHRQTLVHSRVVQVLVGELAASPQAEASIRFETDYVLTHRLTGETLARFGEHDLSLMLNGDDQGTHQLRVFGKQGFGADVSFTAGQLEALVGELRAALRQTAWGDVNEWSAGPAQRFRYEGQQSPADLAQDLKTLARAGRRCFDQVRRPVAQALARKGRALEPLVEPSYIQFASRCSPAELVPLSVLYDRRLDPNLRDLGLCPGFVQALDDPAPARLEDSPCWNGHCPSQDSESTVCPSGFWGFRHFLGSPVTIGDGEDGGAAPDLGCVGAPRITIAVCTDPELRLREQHVRQLAQLFPGTGLADTRDKTLEALKGATGHVAYFYCHGDYVGLLHNQPALLVGPKDSERIDATVISDSVHWKDVRPLVFLNGCRTTALLPSKSFDLVTAFIQDANAAGVVGTEITVFESLATDFGLEFLRGLLTDNLAVGVAMRRARLALLRQRNPLGLVYIPFALSRLTLRPAAAPGAGG